MPFRAFVLRVPSAEGLPRVRGQNRGSISYALNKVLATSNAAGTFVRFSCTSKGILPQIWRAGGRHECWKGRGTGLYTNRGHFVLCKSSANKMICALNDLRSQSFDYMQYFAHPCTQKVLFLTGYRIGKGSAGGHRYKRRRSDSSRPVWRTFLLRGSFVAPNVFAWDGSASN